MMSLTKEDLQSITNIVTTSISKHLEPVKIDLSEVKLDLHKVRSDVAELKISTRDVAVLLEAVDAKTNTALDMLSNVLHSEMTAKEVKLRLDLAEADIKIIKTIAWRHYNPSNGAATV